MTPRIFFSSYPSRGAVFSCDPGPGRAAIVGVLALRISSWWPTFSFQLDRERREIRELTLFVVDAVKVDNALIRHVVVPVLPFALNKVCILTKSNLQREGFGFPR